ncbi:MAG: hypothetical protein J1F63_03275 [Oscillospiraceae bacterium]|nr:hypothetical protein [Oscillospiraceae bacterium]
MNEEMIKKAKETKTVEELIALANENDIELTEELAKEYFERLHATGELADDELENVSGGGCRTVDGWEAMAYTKKRDCPTCQQRTTHKVFVKWGYGYKYQCKKCGNEDIEIGPTVKPGIII